MSATPSASTIYGDQAIAITGMACRFPGAEDLDAFWRLLREGRNALRTLSEEELSRAGVDPALYRDPHYVRAVSEVDQIDRFDGRFFGISDREAALIDPQQRILLECAYAALEHAGRPAETNGLKTGVFVGVGINGYLVHNLRHLVSASDPARAFEILIASDKDYAATRIAYRLGLSGPAVNVNTACSTSLVAICQAIRSLLAYDCDVALAGAAKLNVPAATGYLHQPDGVMSADGLCRAFDAAGTGPIFGSGAGAVVLRRLQDALDDGDTVHAVILSAAVNNDGARKVGFVAPSVAGQSEVIAEALAVAGIDVEQIECLEAHGTGTSLGDPIEIAALEKAFRRHTRKSGYCAIGSVKTNVGHLEAAAGMAGLIKLVLSLEHEQIPPSLNFTQPNPEIDFARTPFFVNTTLRRWPRAAQPRLAGLSSFGIGGTNAHLILAEPPPAPPATRPERVTSVLTLSADSRETLAQLAERTARHLEAEASAGTDVQDVCYTSQLGRQHRAFRMAVVGDSADSLRARVRDPASAAFAVHQGVASARPPALAMLFAGQGTFYQRMGEGLHRHVPAFRKHLDHMDALFRRLQARSLYGLLWDAQGKALESTENVQPAMFAVQVALARTLMDWGIRPRCVAGHSVGEYAAACIAGVFDEEAGLRLLIERGRLMQATPEGRMIAVNESDAIRPWLEAHPQQLSVAAYNGAGQVVLAGAPAIVEAIAQANPSARTLGVDRAFHSPLMQGVPALLRPLLATVALREPRIPFLTSSASGLLPHQAEYWAEHVVQPVRFDRTLEQLVGLRIDAFLDVSPRGVLSAIGARHSVLGEKVWIRCMDSQQPEDVCIASVLAKLHTLGVEVDWVAYHAHERRRRVPLPTYPFERRRHWIDPVPSGPKASSSAPASIEASTEQPAVTRDCYEVVWRDSPVPQPRAQVAAQHVIVLADAAGVGAALAARLEASGTACTLLPAALPAQQGEPRKAVADAVLRCLSADPRRCLIVDLRALGLRTKADDDPDPVEALEPLVNTYLQVFAALRGRKGRYWLVTRHAQAPACRERIDPLGMALWGLGRTFAQEHPEHWGGLIDLDDAESQPLADFVLAELGADEGGVEVARAGDRRLQPALAPVQDALQPLTLREDGVYLILGGLGGLGLSVARHFADHGARHLLLVSRSAQEHAQPLPGFPPGVDVQLVAADLRDAADVRRVVALAAKQARPLRGIVHAAGELNDRLLAHQDWPGFAQALGAKLSGTWHLHRALGDQPLDFLVLFSSITSILGSAGQGAYAMANAWLDGFAHFRQSQGARTLAIGWGPWRGAGMAGRMAARAKARLESMGLAFLEPEQALGVLSAALRGSSAHRVVMPLNRDAAARATEHVPAIARAIISPSVEAAPRVSGLEELKSLRESERADWMRGYLRQLLARSLHIERDALPLDVDLVALGLDSLIVMEAIRSLRADLGLVIYPREVYEHRSVEALADYLLSQVVPEPEAEPATAAASLSQRAATTAFAPISEQERREGLVFILSSPRSGSTLLRAMLAGHARLFAPPELHLLPFSTMRQREEALASTHLGEGLQRAIMELLGADADAAREVLHEMVADDYPIHRVYAWLLDHAGGRLLVDKSPTYGLEISTLHRAEALFARARYVHLVRHPQAVTESFARMRLHKLFSEVVGSAEQVGEHVWYVTNANIGQFLSTVDTARHLRLRYEDLVSDPAAHIAAICALLDLAPQAAMLDPYDGNRMRDGVYSHSLPIGDPNFNRHDRIDHTLAEYWRDHASGRAFSPPSVTLAQHLGYALTVETTVDATGETRTGGLAPAPSAQAIEHTYRSGGYALSVSEWGPRSGPAVLCVHGAMEHGHSWQWLAAHLAAAGTRVLAPDLRGHGLSEHQRRGNALSIHDWLLDLDALLEDFDLRQVQLVGHSMGTLLTSTLAALRPERIQGLTLIEPILPSITDLPSRLARLLREGRESPEPVMFDSREAAVERLRRANPALEPAEADALAERSLTRTEQGWHWRWDPRLSARTFAVDADREEYLALLGSLRLPVTIVRGHDSPFGRQSDVEAWSGALRHAQTYLMDGAHHPHVRCADRVARLVLSQQHAARGTGGGPGSAAGEAG